MIFILIIQKTNIRQKLIPIVCFVAEEMVGIGSFIFELAASMPDVTFKCVMPSKSI